MTDPGPEEMAPVVDLTARTGGDAVDDLLTAGRREVLGGPGVDGGAEADSDGSGDALIADLSAALPAPRPWLRATIGAVGVAQLVLVAPWLVDSDPIGLLGDTTGAHLTRDGSLGLVVAVTALLTAWRPRWSTPCFAVASVAVVAQAVAGLVDDSIAAGGGGELVHVPSLVLTCLIGLAGVRLAPLGPKDRTPA